MASLIALSARCGRLIVEGSGSEEIFVSAAIFGAATGIALTSAVTAEGVGYLVLLIPRRIKQIKDEALAEARAEVSAEAREKWREEGRAEGREDGLKQGRVDGMREGVEEGLKTGIAVGARSGMEDERGRVRRLLAQYESGEITLDDLLGRLNDGNGAD